MNVTVGSVEEKVKVALAEAIVPEGPESIEVSGGIVSTLQAWEAGEASALPAASVAATSKVWGPSESPV